MPFEALFTWMENTGIGVAMRESATLFPLVECIHVVALTFVVGSIGMIDLRLIGVSARNHSVTQLTNEVLPWTWGAFVVAAISGVLLFCAKATDYAANFPFQMKMVLIVLAGLNMVIFHFVTQKSIAHWDRDAATPVAAKVAGTLSLLFWIGVVTFGRWIGFTVGGGF